MAQQSHILPDCDWQHITFTMSHLLWPFFNNNWPLLNALFRAATRAMLRWARKQGVVLPLSLVVSGANTHDIKLVEDTLDALQTGRPGSRLHLCLDKGNEAEWLEIRLKARRYEPHIQSRKEESDAIKNSGFRAHRWVVERTHSWMNRFRVMPSIDRSFW